MAIYDDRVEVISAGTLPFGLTPQDLTRDHDSRPRNPLLADVFFRRGLIERRGRGMQKIIDLRGPSSRSGRGVLLSGLFRAATCRRAVSVTT